MEVTDSWTAPFGRRGGRITLDESDFTGMLTDWGVPPDMHVELSVKFMILRAAAAIMCLTEFIDYLQKHSDEENQLGGALDDQQAAVRQLDELMKNLKARVSA